MTKPRCTHATLVRAKTGGWYCISQTGCEFSIPEQVEPPALHKWPGEPPHCPTCACGVQGEFRNIDDVVRIRELEKRLGEPTHELPIPDGMSKIELCDEVARLREENAVLRSLKSTAEPPHCSDCGWPFEPDTSGKAKWIHYCPVKSTSCEHRYVNGPDADQLVCRECGEPQHPRTGD